MAKTTKMTPAGGNVFADVGIEPKKAAALKAESQRIVAEQLAIKNDLVTAVAEWIATRKLEKSEAAEILGLTRSRVSALINKKANEFTIDALVGMVARTGRHIQLSIDGRIVSGIDTNLVSAGGDGLSSSK